MTHGFLKINLYTFLHVLPFLGLHTISMFAVWEKMKKREREAFLEDLLASTSPEYLRGIKEARADYKAGRVKIHEEVFGR